MSGHLLQTVNPGATEPQQDLPEEGQRVMYYARPGQGRGGKTQFGADVLHVDRRTGLVTLYILFGREDWVELINQRRRDDQNPYGWDYMPGQDPKQFRELHEGLDRLYEIVLGEFNAPPKSVMEHLAEFEARLADVGGVVQPQRKYGARGRRS